VVFAALLIATARKFPDKTEKKAAADVALRFR
jgi:hypothetical protein